MSDLIRATTNLDELRLVLKNIHESRRQANKAAPAYNSLMRIYQGSTDAQLKQELSPKFLGAVDEMILLLKEYQGDLFYKGSLKDAKIYQSYQEYYNHLQKKLETNNHPRVTNQELQAFHLNLQRLLAHIIKTTQLHLIFLDSTYQLDKAQRVCDQYLPICALGDVLISYDLIMNLEQVLKKYENIPSIYVFFGDSSDQLIQQLIYMQLQQINKQKNKQLIQSCFVTDFDKDNQQRRKLEKNPVFSFVNEIGLVEGISNSIKKVNQIQLVQFLPFNNNDSMQNTLAFLEKYCNLNPEQQTIHMEDLGQKINNSYKLFFSRNQNKENIYFKCLEIIWNCFQNDIDPQQLSLSILQNFLGFRHYINQYISREQPDEMAQYQDLISTVFLAFQIYSEDKKIRLGYDYLKSSIYLAIVVEENETKYLEKGNVIMLPRFTYAYLNITQAATSISYPPSEKLKTVVLRYQFDGTIKSKNAFKSFKDKNGYLVLMSLPTEFFLVDETSYHTVAKCSVVNIN